MSLLGVLTWPLRLVLCLAAWSIWLVAGLFLIFPSLFCEGTRIAADAPASFTLDYIEARSAEPDPTEGWTRGFRRIWAFFFGGGMHDLDARIRGDAE